LGLPGSTAIQVVAGWLSIMGWCGIEESRQVEQRRLMFVGHVSKA
jgi:hypothetical protein